MVTVSWGTNAPGGRGHRYGGRLHVVWPGGPAIALCGLPVEQITAHRPPIRLRLCPECCLCAMARLF
jgi:hypothetical protein